MPRLECPIKGCTWLSQDLGVEFAAALTTSLQMHDKAVHSGPSPQCSVPPVLVHTDTSVPSVERQPMNVSSSTCDTNTSLQSVRSPNLRPAIDSPSQNLKKQAHNLSSTLTSESQKLKSSGFAEVSMERSAQKTKFAASDCTPSIEPTTSFAKPPDEKRKAKQSGSNKEMYEISEESLLKEEPGVSKDDFMVFEVTEDEETSDIQVEPIDMSNYNNFSTEELWKKSVDSKLEALYKGQEKLIRMQSSFCKRLASIDMKLSKVFELDTAQHQDMFVPIGTMSDLMQFNQRLGADREFAERMSIKVESYSYIEEPRKRMSVILNDLIAPNIQECFTLLRRQSNKMIFTHEVPNIWRLIRAHCNMAESRCRQIMSDHLKYSARKNQSASSILHV